MPDSARSSWTSSRRTSLLPIRYSLSPERKIERLTLDLGHRHGDQPRLVVDHELTSAIPRAGAARGPREDHVGHSTAAERPGPCSPSA